MNLIPFIALTINERNGADRLYVERSVLRHVVLGDADSTDPYARPLVQLVGGYVLALLTTEAPDLRDGTVVKLGGLDTGLFLAQGYMTEPGSSPENILGYPCDLFRLKADEVPPGGGEPIPFDSLWGTFKLLDRGRGLQLLELLKGLKEVTWCAFHEQVPVACTGEGIGLTIAHGDVIRIDVEGGQWLDVPPAELDLLIRRLQLAAIILKATSCST